MPSSPVASNETGQSLIPSTFRHRLPCPWTFRLSPGGLAGALQFGHSFGRTRSTDGKESGPSPIHSLQLMSARITLVVLVLLIDITSTAGRMWFGRYGLPATLSFRADDVSMLSLLESSNTITQGARRVFRRNGNKRPAGKKPSSSLHQKGRLRIKCRDC